MVACSYYFVSDAGTVFSNEASCNGTFTCSSHANVLPWCSWYRSATILWAGTSCYDPSPGNGSLLTCLYIYIYEYALYDKYIDVGRLWYNCPYMTVLSATDFCCQYVLEIHLATENSCYKSGTLTYCQHRWLAVYIYICVFIICVLKSLPRAD